MCEVREMYCYDEQGNMLGVVSCFPDVGEQHMWGDDVYECVGDNGKRDCTFGMVFKHVERVVYAQ
jgi:hypothetical protein